jgi:hypothetical protein
MTMTARTKTIHRRTETHFGKLALAAFLLGVWYYAIPAYQRYAADKAEAEITGGRTGVESLLKVLEMRRGGRNGDATLTSTVAYLGDRKLEIISTPSAQGSSAFWTKVKWMKHAECVALGDVMRKAPEGEHSPFIPTRVRVNASEMKGPSDFDPAVCSPDLKDPRTSVADDIGANIVTFEFRSLSR